MKRIFLIDDHPVFRVGITSVIALEPDLEVCGSVSTAREALERLPGAAADLVISDLTLPDKNGLELIKDIRPHLPALPILVVSMHEEEVYAMRVIRAGARGYLMKEKSDQLIPAIRTVLAGHVYVDPAMLSRFLGTGVPGPLDCLSDRELQVFEMVGWGKSNVQIADQLHISERTVDAHCTHIRSKMGLEDHIALLCCAVHWVESGKPANRGS